jgi:integral membrane protein (TIGR00529 family)
MIPLLLLFALTVVLIRFKAPIGATLIAGAIFLGIYHFGVGRDFWLLLWKSLTSLATWRLVLTVALILTFAHIFESAGFVRSMVSSLQSFLPPAWVSRVAPSIIGLLPMPGGAMVSAPIVKHIGEGTDTSPEQFTAANYWWRHVWETTWPLYPSIILAAAVLKVSVWDVARINFPISLTCIAAGFILKRIGSLKRSGGSPDWVSLVRSLWPILFIVLLGLVFKIDLIISVIFVLVVVIIRRKISRSAIIAGLKSGFSVGIITLIFGVMTLMYAIETTGVAAAFYGELLQIHIPPLMVVFVVPFMVGVLTGVTSAYIGVGFPIVLPLLGTAAVSQSAGMLMAFAGGFMGVMASPVHLCLVLTHRYFQASLARTLSLLILPILLTSVISWVMAMVVYP